jgi:hypothetical protein
MTQTKRQSASPLSFASITITLLAILSLVTTIAPVPKISFHSPTATYSAYLSVSYTGVYHHVDAQPLCSEVFPPCLVPSEPVFYLTAENATNIQLVFYCGPDYCWSAQQLPFSDGTRIHVEGTLLTPSRWPASEYRPTLQFIADLYVFNYTTT